MDERKRDTIITSPTAERMLGRVSPIYDESYVGLWMFEAIGREYDKLWDVAKTLPDQLFPESVTWGIELWERRYAITPTPGQTLEERRQKVLAMRSTPHPFNCQTVENYIRLLTGREAEIVDYVRNFTFGIYLTSTEDMQETVLNDIVSYLNRHKPSHMSYELAFQSLAEIKIGVETGYWRFPYHMTGTARTGQLPQPSTTFGAADAQIIAHCEATGYRYPYTAAGTKPDVNIALSAVASEIDVAADAQPYLFPYPMTGDGEAGEQPEYTMTGSAESASIRASPEGKAYGIIYTPCGAINAGTVIL